jgi:hypothetical protein
VESQTPEDTPVQIALADPVPSKAGPSSLSAEFRSIERLSDGLRVTIQFNNSASLPLSTVIDAEVSVMTDDKGTRYSIVESDLPFTGEHPRLELAANASTSHTFDFPAATFGATKFYLALSARGGGAVKLSGSPKTLEGSL